MTPSPDPDAAASAPPLARAGTAEEIAESVRWLLQDATYLTGEILRLDGGRYDNLVRQMERVAHMPVVLAEAGTPAEAGHIYVLPGDVVPFVDAGQVAFRPGAVIHTMIPQLPPADSAVLLLSGSDNALVDPAATLGTQGALVLGQSQEGCYDPAAPRALAARGADLGTPVQLAQRLTDRWF